MNPDPRPKLVLVDDEPYILEALSRQLRAEPYDVLTFNDPLQALAGLLEQGEIAVILSDNRMPALTGLALLKRAMELVPHTRRLLLTGHTELNEAIGAFNEGVIHRFINKPWDADDLRAVLAEEAKKFGELRGGHMERGKWEGFARQKQSELTRTVDDLKQALTQVSLYEDSSHLRRLRVSPRLKRMSFLVVDSTPSVRHLLTSALQGAGILSCHCVGSAEEALSYLRTVPSVDVILSEWNLAQGMDGLLLFHAVRNGQTPSAKSMFFLMTTREHRSFVEEALQAGVDYYLIKPFHLDTLFEQIEKRLRKAPRLSQERRIAPLRPLSFVIANTDQDSRYRLQQMLLLNGIQNVTIADSGLKALRVVREKKVDVLILDRNLLDVDWDALREHLVDSACEGIPPALVVSSVAPLAQEFQAVQRAGFSAFLPGPFLQREFFDAIYTALQEEGRLFDDELAKDNGSAVPQG